MVHTRHALRRNKLTWGKTKAWQPTGKLTKSINTTAITDEQMMMMIHVDNLKKGWVLSMFL
jgi:hypothetical protein